VPKVPRVKGTKMTITCFRPVFIGLEMGFPILLNYMVTSNHIHLSREARDFASSTCVDAGGRGVIPKSMHLIAGREPGRNIIKGKIGKVHSLGQSLPHAARCRGGVAQHAPCH
jgi:hypothetical protein